ncbi:MAG: DUF4102 domain-containing protein [Mesorhizobium sp.]|nr:MAG: DUF4102 domain-containing protein [Mesorhizobium sp.]
MKLDDKIAASLSLPDGKTDFIEWDATLPAFGVRIREGGSRTWIVQYAIKGKQRRMSLGRVAGMKCVKARDMAGDVLANVRLGKDPQGEKIEARQRPKTLTAGEVIKLYLKRQESRLKPRSYSEQKRHLETVWKPLHSHQIDTITRNEIARQLTKLKAVNVFMADHARVDLSSMFNWAMKEGLCGDLETNPVFHTHRPLTEPVSRDRVLITDKGDPAELREVWNALLDDDFGRFVKLLLLTAQRRTEIADLRWTEIDMDEKDPLIDLPASRMKNGLPHEVPLTDAALAVLPERREGRDHLFGRGGGGFSGFSKAKRELDQRILSARLKIDPEAKPMPRWTLHDLRRTASTIMHDDELNIEPRHVEAVLAHVGHKAGVAGTYNKAKYRKPKRRALTLWSEYVLSAVEGKAAKIIPLKTA